VILSTPITPFHFNIMKESANELFNNGDKYYNDDGPSMGNQNGRFHKMRSRISSVFL